MPRCAHCGAADAPSAFKCPSCPSNKQQTATFHVCGRGCQKAFWRAHKARHELDEARSSSLPCGLGRGDPEWLVDCYRLRVDDEAFIGGNARYIHPCLAAELGFSRARAEIFGYFAAFVKMSRASLPESFDYAGAARLAAEWLGLATEQQDVNDRHGMFAATEMRAFAQRVFGKSCTRSGWAWPRVAGLGPEWSADSERIADAMEEIAEEVRRLCAEWDPEFEYELDDEDEEKEGGAPNAEEVFKEIGGVAVWRELFETMEVPEFEYELDDEDEEKEGTMEVPEGQ